MSRIMAAAIGACAYVAFATSAFGADMPAPLPTKAPMAAPFAWTGCYIGVHGGYGWGRTRRHDGSFTITEEQRIDGALVGGHVGCNVQHDRWVFGLEGQASWTGIDGVSEVIADAPLGSQHRFHTDVDVLGTIAGRIGRAFDRTLLYAKGGVAFGREQHWQSLDFVPVYVSERYMRWGWMAGGGIERGLSNAWSAKIEYNYVHFGTDSARFCEMASGTCDTEGNKQHIHLVKAGISYRFGAAPLIARY